MFRLKGRATSIISNTAQQPIFPVSGETLRDIKLVLTIQGRNLTQVIAVPGARKGEVRSWIQAGWRAVFAVFGLRI